MKSFSFIKMSGAGNDFVLFDKKLNPDLTLSGESIKKICDRRFGVGADGIIVIDDSLDLNFEMEYYNSDGSTGSLCGNGARCAIKYGTLSNRNVNELIRFKSNGKEYSGKMLNLDSIRFYLNQPEGLRLNFNVGVAGKKVNASFVNTGAPHLVINLNDLLSSEILTDLNSNDFESLPVYDLGREIRFSKDFAPDGVNVNFIKIGEQNIEIRTYERGVENETLACGTGSVAAAIILYENYNVNPPVELKTKGGRFLEVDFIFGGQKYQDLSLTGPAEVVFKGELSI